MVVMLCGSLLSNVPLYMSCIRYETIGGTVYIMTLENDDLIIKKHQQECSLEDGWIARHENWPVMFLSLDERYDFSEIFGHKVLSASLAWWLLHKCLTISPRILIWPMSIKNWRKPHWIRSFVLRKKSLMKQDLPSYHSKNKAHHHTLIWSEVVGLNKNQ